MSRKRFNIRVYGIMIQHGCMLVNEEIVKGSKIIKFPGGGLDWGEGTIDCLKREWKEELNIDIIATDHFYTTDYFQPSFFDDSQVISIYYFVASVSPEINIANQNAAERTYWLDLIELKEDTFSLPIDKIVGDKLRVLRDNVGL